MILRQQKNWKWWCGLSCYEWFM